MPSIKFTVRDLVISYRPRRNTVTHCCMVKMQRAMVHPQDGSAAKTKEFVSLKLNITTNVQFITSGPSVDSEVNIHLKSAT